MAPVNRARAKDEQRRRDAAEGDLVRPDEPDGRCDPRGDAIARGKLTLSMIEGSIISTWRTPTLGDRWPGARPRLPAAGRASAQLELDRLRRVHTFMLDPTEEQADTAVPPPEALRSRLAWEGRRKRAAQVASRYAFWRESVAWLARWREQLTDEACDVILAWASRRQAEIEQSAPGARSSWRGRTPASARAAAARSLAPLRSASAAGRDHFAARITRPSPSVQ